MMRLDFLREQTRYNKYEVGYLLQDGKRKITECQKINFTSIFNTFSFTLGLEMVR